MCGEARYVIVNEDGDIEEYHSLTSTEILTYWGIAPSSVELAVRRLCWWHSILAEPLHHKQFMAGFFGDYKFETARRQSSRKCASGRHCVRLQIPPGGQKALPFGPFGSSSNTQSENKGFSAPVRQSNSTM